MRYEFHPEVILLLQNDSFQKVEMIYLEHKWTMPKISTRPPYYTAPSYELNFPII